MLIRHKTGISIIVLFIVLVFAVVIFSPAAVNENRINPKVKIQLLEDQAQNYYLQGEMDNGAPFKINLIERVVKRKKCRGHRGLNPMTMSFKTEVDFWIHKSLINI